jgi:hypothetical protein
LYWAKLGSTNPQTQKNMKPNAHLIYGIIIGILIMACAGSKQSTTTTTTPTAVALQRVVLCGPKGNPLSIITDLRGVSYLRVWDAGTAKPFQDQPPPFDDSAELDF